MVEINHMVGIPCSVNIPSKHISRYQFAPQAGPNITIISGGSGASSLAKSLKSYTYNSNHILTMFDDGGSSKVIRDAFDMPPPGDLRNRILSLADETEQDQLKIIEVLAHRLSISDYENGSLQKELNSFINGTNPLIKNIDPSLASIICFYLNQVNQFLPKNFDLRKASIGNLAITGCYLLHGRNFENAICLFSSLLKVRGKVIPVTLGNYYLGAELINGTIINRQANITTQNGKYSSPIKRMLFQKKIEGSVIETEVSANPRAISSFADVDLIVYSMGSFYTSIVPCLMTTGLATTIRKSTAPKVFIANSIEDDETKGLRVSDLLSILHNILSKYDSKSYPITDYIQYVVSNDHGFHKDYRGIFGYIPIDRENIEGMGIKVLEFPLEERKGKFKSELLAQIILSFVHS